MRSWTFALALGALACAGGGAYAGGVPYPGAYMSPVADEGNWVAFSSAGSITDPPGGCVAASLSTPSMQLRTDLQGNITIHFLDASWTVHKSAKGEIDIIVNNNQYAYPIVGDEGEYTYDFVDSSLTRDQLTALVYDMEQANSLQISAIANYSIDPDTTTPDIPTQPITISLKGAKTVLGAFMACVGMPDPAQS